MGFGNFLKEGQEALNSFNGNGENKEGGSKPDYSAYAEDAKDAYTAFSGQGTFQDRAQKAYTEISANHSGKKEEQKDDKKEEDKKE